jgi:hypothetical protein
MNLMHNSVKYKDELVAKIRAWIPYNKDWARNAEKFVEGIHKGNFHPTLATSLKFVDGVLKILKDIELVSTYYQLVDEDGEIYQFSETLIESLIEAKQNLSHPESGIDYGPVEDLIRSEDLVLLADVIPSCYERLVKKQNTYSLEDIKVLEYRIREEGREYALEDYSDWEEIDNDVFQKLLKDYRSTVEKIDEFIRTEKLRLNGRD